METTLAILMVLGIFIGIPAVIGLAIAGAYVLRDHRVRKAERAKAAKGAEAVVKELTKEPVQVA